MRYARVLVELIHLAAGILAVAAIFGAAASVYRPGYATIWNIGFITMAAVAGMSIPEVRKAWIGAQDKSKE